MTDKPAVASVPIDPLLARRWSPRAIDGARPVARDQLVALIEAARWAPSSGNWQPWRFVVWERDADPAAWQRAAAALDDGNRAWALRAPVLIAVCADRLDRRDRPSRFAGHDAGLATQNLLLQAATLGLVAHPMGGYDAAALRAAAAVPDRFETMAMIALGHPGDPAELSAKDQGREAAPRVRRALDELVFAASWGRPLG